MPSSLLRLLLRPLSLVVILLALHVPGCAAEDDPSAPPAAACGTKDAPESCACGTTRDCAAGYCCRQGPLGTVGEDRCVAYEGAYAPGCMP